MRSCGPADEIGRGQIDLLFALLGEFKLLHVIIPPGEIEVALLVEVGQEFLYNRGQIRSYLVSINSQIGLTIMS